MNLVAKFLVFGLIWATSTFGQVAAETLAIINGTVIDGVRDKPLKKATVLIDDGRIVEISASKNLSIPASATVLDASGKFIIPGLMDANLHLYLNTDPETLIKYESRYDEIIIEAAQITLSTGLTTVFDTWGPYGPLEKARDAINRGAAVGSRIYFAGNIIGFDGPVSADFRGAVATHLSQAFVDRVNETWQQGVGRDLMWRTPDEVREEIRAYAASNVDFLKYASSGHVDMAFIVFSQRVQNLIVEEGHRAGKTVQVHTTSVESLDMAIEAGVDFITHCDITGPKTQMPDEAIQKMVDRGIACSILPITTRRMEAISNSESLQDIAPYMQNSRTNIANLIKGNAKLLLSTDAGIEHPILAAEKGTATVDNRTKLGVGHFSALVALEEMGMPPMEILRSATSNIAEAYKLADKFGTLQEGKIADLVILEKNPLKSAENYKSIFAVIKEGNQIDIQSLPTSPIISSIEVPEKN